MKTLLKSLGWLDRHTPRLASRVAERIFCTPPPPRLPEHARHFLRTGEKHWVTWQGLPLATWSWGQGPTVLLLHGWGGRSSQFAAFVPALVAAGCRVVAMDAPAHGGSKGKTTSPLDFALALRAVAEHVGPLHAVLTHSVGGAAAAYAIRDGLPCERAVFIAPPSDPAQFTRQFAERVRLSRRTYELMHSKVVQRAGGDWIRLKVPSFAPDLRTPLLVIHDKDDADVTYRSGVAIAEVWPGARLLLTEGLGHKKILRTPSVVDAVVQFIGVHPPVTCSTCDKWVPPTQQHCPDCSLEQQLFDPAVR